MSSQYVNKVKTIEERLNQSNKECLRLDSRDIKCPYCNFKVQTVFSDATGHLQIRCSKCKRVFNLNLAYFRKGKARNKSS